MKYEFTDQIKNNLLAFLNRVDLKGAEVGAYLDIINCLNNPIKDEVPEENKQ